MQIFERETNREKNLEKALKEAKIKARKEAAKGGDAALDADLPPAEYEKVGFRARTERYSRVATPQKALHASLMQVWICKEAAMLPLMGTWRGQDSTRWASVGSKGAVLMAHLGWTACGGKPRLL